MPFLVSREQPHGRLYLRRYADGELYWQPNRDKATRFEEDEADKTAAAINVHSSTEATVEGVR